MFYFCISPPQKFDVPVGTIHLMPAPKGNSKFSFPESLNVSQTSESRGKRKFAPEEGVIKCFVM